MQEKIEYKYSVIHPNLFNLRLRSAVKNGAEIAKTITHESQGKLLERVGKIQLEYTQNMWGYHRHYHTRMQAIQKITKCI